MEILLFPLKIRCSNLIIIIKKWRIRMNLSDIKYALFLAIGGFTFLICFVLFFDYLFPVLFNKKFIYHDELTKFLAFFYTISLGYLFARRVKTNKYKNSLLLSIMVTLLFAVVLISSFGLFLIFTSICSTLLLTHVGIGIYFLTHKT